MPRGRPRDTVTYNYTPEQLAQAKALWDRKARDRDILAVLGLAKRTQLHNVARREGWPPRRTVPTRRRAATPEELERRRRRRVAAAIELEEEPMPPLGLALPPRPLEQIQHLAQSCPGCGYRVAPALGVWHEGELYHVPCCPVRAA